MLILYELERRQPQGFHEERNTGKEGSFSHVTRPAGSSALMAPRGGARLLRVSGGLGGSVCGLPPDCTWQYQPRAVSEW